MSSLASPVSLLTSVTVSTHSSKTSPLISLSPNTQLPNFSSHCSQYQSQFQHINPRLLLSSVSSHQSQSQHTTPRLILTSVTVSTHSSKTSPHIVLSLSLSIKTQLQDYSSQQSPRISLRLNTLLQDFSPHQSQSYHTTSRLPLTSGTVLTHNFKTSPHISLSLNRHFQYH